MSELSLDCGHRQVANLTALQRELADLASNTKENRPPRERPAEIHGPMLVIRGK